MDLRHHRLEWISLVYLLFFVLAVLSPSMYRRGYFGLSETALEELTIFVFGLAGILTFTLYERLMERREKEREHVQNQYDKAKLELIESYAYIGSVNRKIELLKTLANDTSLTFVDDKRLRKELFQALIANAASSVGADSALIRFVDLPRLRTDREFFHRVDPPGVIRISNRDLRLIHEQQEPHSFLLSEDQKEILVVPSDTKEATIKAYLLLHLEGHHIPEVDVSLLKVFVNQAEMLYRHLPWAEQTNGEVSVSVAAQGEAGVPVSEPSVAESAAKIVEHI